MLDSTKEFEIREALGQKIANITGSVFVRRPVLDSKQDWLELMSVTVANGTLLRYCMVDLLSFTDSDTDGCDDDPLVTLLYSAHFFHQFKETIETLHGGTTSSTDLFDAAVMDLRAEFLLDNRTLGSPAIAGAEHLPLSQSGFIILGDDPLIGAFGHYIDLQARVQVS